MELFDKRYVYFMWDSKLFGKPCFVANSVNELKQQVNSVKTDRRTVIGKSPIKDSPFFSGSTWKHYKFAYFDPNYECKIAYNEGKPIEYFCNLNQKWTLVKSPRWFDSDLYRVKKEESKLCTNIELAKWVSKGNGQVKRVCEDFANISFNYHFREENEEVSCDIVVRKWGDSLWFSPTKEYLEIE